MPIVIDPFLVQEAVAKLDVSDEAVHRMREKAEHQLADSPQYNADRYEVVVTVSVSVHAMGPDENGKDCLLVLGHLGHHTEDNYVRCGLCP